MFFINVKYLYSKLMANLLTLANNKSYAKKILFFFEMTCLYSIKIDGTWTSFREKKSLIQKYLKYDYHSVLRKEKKIFHRELFILHKLKKLKVAIVKKTH